MVRVKARDWISLWSYPPITNKDWAMVEVRNCPVTAAAISVEPQTCPVFIGSTRSVHVYNHDVKTWTSLWECWNKPIWWYYTQIMTHLLTYTAVGMLHSQRILPEDINTTTPAAGISWRCLHAHLCHLSALCASPGPIPNFKWPFLHHLGSGGVISWNT